MKLASALYGLLVCVLAFGASGAEPAAVVESGRLEEQGRFTSAAEVLRKALSAPALAQSERKQLEFELDRLGRIRRDFPLTQQALFERLTKAVRGLTAAEFEQWIAEGRFDSRPIDGQRFFMTSSVKNLFWRHPELNARRIDAKDESGYHKALWESCVAIREAARRQGKPYVLPKRFRVTMTVTVDAGAVPGGEIVRAWLPVPRRYPFQSDFELRASSPPVRQLAPEDSPIRSVYLEQPAREGRPTEFRIEYGYTVHGVCFDVRPDKVRPADPTDPALAPFLREGPHVTFTPQLRATAGRIAGAETTPGAAPNPARVAKAFYDWIAENILYSYAVEYSTVRDLGDYCFQHRYGDCGQEAMLFITLCRMRGIPARWQSGWNTFPSQVDMHDWTEIYLAPYGWVPVDPWAGLYATRYATGLSTAERREVRDFYFGGLDQYRMAANGDHCQTLSPPKRSLRSDNVDFQRGELEWGEHNIYFDHYSYRLESVTADR